MLFIIIWYDAGNVVTFIHCLLQDYVSVWQVRDALERSRIVPVFVLQVELRPCILQELDDGTTLLLCTNPTLQREPYEDLLQDFDLRNIRGQFRLFNSTPGQNPSDVTDELINIIQGAYSVSIHVCPSRRVSGSELTPRHKMLSSLQALHATRRRSLRVPALALATGMNTSFLDRFGTKPSNKFGTYISVACSYYGRQAA